MAKKQEHPNLAKNKKIKFSATMPQHEESEEVGSEDEDVQSQSREESFSGNDSSEDSMEVSGSEENSEDSKEQEQSKGKQGKRREEEGKGHRNEDKKIVIKSGGNQDRGEQQDDRGDQSQEGSGSDSGQQQSSYQSQAQSSQQSPQPNSNPQPQTLPQPTQAPLASTAISQNPNPTIQSSQVSSSQQSSSHHSVPQQQMQTDDFDSGVVNGEEVVGEGQLQGQRQESRIQQEDTKKMNSQQKQVEQNVTVRQDKEEIGIPMQMQVQNAQLDLTKARVKSQEGNSDKGQVAQGIVQQQSEDAKAPESKQTTKPKKPKQAPSKKPSKPQAIPPIQTIQQQQQKIQQQSANDPTDNSSDQDEDSFYEYIHPYLMLVGSEIVENYMSKKLQYKPSQASMWATELSSQVLLTTYFDGVGQPQGVDEEQDMQKKQKLMQKAILENEFYRSLHSQMQALHKQQAIPKLSLGKLYFMIKRYKTIASCIMVQRKPNKQYSLNVSSSGFWNRRKDGQINFTYENKNIYVFLTLYGVERDRDAGEV